MDDLISRQAMLDGIDKLIKIHFDRTVVLYKARKVAEDLPSVQPERKTGRWIPDNTDYYRTRFICSACGESEEVPTTGFGNGTMWDYCPMCGAKMEGGEAE